MTVITHNVTAMNADRQLEINTEKKKKSVEKLSSGYRINRSADDAAGLQISEKMRKQVRGLNKASNNIQDGMSMIQTADGALAEVHDILQRMNELATQAANDTNVDEDREALHKELVQLKSEINRTGRTTQFNTHTILWAKQLVEIDVEDYDNILMEDLCSGVGKNNHQSKYGKVLDFKNINQNNKEELIGKSFVVTCSENCSQTFTFKFSDQTSSKIDVTGAANRPSLVVDIGVKDANITNGADIAKQIYDLVDGQQGAIGPIGGSSDDMYIGHANGISINGSKMTFYSITGGPTYSEGMGLVLASDLMNLEQDYKLQVSDNPYQEITLKLRTISASTLGLGKMNVDSFENAGKTMDEVRGAIDNLSEYRAYLGAMQNRLEKAMANVDNTSENTQRSESKLRDTDMAEEMVRYSKNKILEQFGQVMLAQTNQMTEGVASLLV